MKKFSSYFKKYMLQTILAPLFKMIEAMFELLVPKVIAYLIGTGVKEAKLGNYNPVIISVCLLLLLALLGITSSITAQYFSAKVAVNVSKEIKRDSFKHIESLSYADLNKLGTSNIISNLTSDINQVQTGINMMLRLLLRAPIVVFGAAIMTFTISVKSGYIILATIPLLFVIVFSITYISIPRLSNVQKKLSSLLRKSRENLKGVRVLRAFNQENIEIESFTKENEDYTKSNIKVNALTSLINPLTYVTVNAAIVLILYFSSNQVFEGKLTQPNVIALYSYISQVLVELIKVSNLIITLSKAIACYKRIKEVYSINPSQSFVDESNLIENNTDTSIKFEDVTFNYTENGTPVVNNISFEAKKGEIIGIIGSTGSGKTSLANLLPRFYDATSGSIEIDGNPIENYSKHDIRNLVGFVSQKKSFIPGTLREVISFGGNYTDAEIIESIRIAQGMNILEAHNEGLDYYITSGAKNLSGGQKQRISIARTLVRKTPIIVLDSVTSALDYITEKKLKEEIKNLSWKPTVVMVSDRVSALASCDRILVLDNGKNAGFDTPSNLLKNSEVYKEIYYSQSVKEEM